jgi:hypothetical protein
MHKTLLFSKLCLLFLLASLSSKADTCLPDVEGLCTPGVTIEEEVTVEKTEEDKGTEIIYTTTTTKTTTTTTVTNEDSGNIVDEPDMNFDWGGEGPANMPLGTYCGDLGTDTCAEITGSGDTKSRMLVEGMGTTFYQEVDVSDLSIDNGGQVTYSIKVDKQDAQDRIYMHVTGTGGGTIVFSGTDILSESGITSGYQTYNGSFDFSRVLSKVTIEIGGRNINLAVGPMFDDVSVNVFYNVISTIIEQQITTVEEIVYLNLTDPTQIDLIEEIIEYNDIKIDDDGKIDFTPLESAQQEVSYETVEAEIDFKIEDIKPEPEMEMASVEAEMEIEMEMEVVDEPVEETNEPDSETTQEPIVETEDSTQQEEVQQEETEEPKPIKEPSAKEKAATKIVKEIDDKERYDETNQLKTLIIMQILGDTKTFFETQSTIQDTNVNQYLSKILQDPYAKDYSLAQDYIMEQIVNSQYGRN